MGPQDDRSHDAKFCFSHSAKIAAKIIMMYANINLCTANNLPFREEHKSVSKDTVKGLDCFRDEIEV